MGAVDGNLVEDNGGESAESAGLSWGSGVVEPSCTEQES